MVKLPYLHSIANVSLVSFFHIKLPRGSKVPKKSCLHVFVQGSKCGQTTIFAQYSKCISSIIFSHNCPGDQMYPKNHVCMYLFRVANVVKLPYLHSIANVSLVSFFHIIAQGIKCNKKNSCLHVFVQGSKCGQTTIFAQYSKCISSIIFSHNCPGDQM